MYHFSFVTKSSDGKMTGSVDWRFISQVLMSRSITGTQYSESGTRVGLTLSDGAHLWIELMANVAEVRYYAPE